MLNLVKTFVLLSTLLIVGCASGPSGKSFDSAMGWELAITTADWYSAVR